MVTMTVKVFDDCNERGKYTKAEVEQIIRKFFAKKNGVEIAPLVFQRDDELAIGSFSCFFELWMHDKDFLDSISECKWNINGTVENCLEAFKEVQRTIVM